MTECPHFIKNEKNYCLLSVSEVHYNTKKKIVQKISNDEALAVQSLLLFLYHVTFQNFAI